MKSEDERLVRPAVQLAGQDPTRPSVENRIWESFCEWHYREHGWEPSKDQRYESGTHTRNVWQAYQAGVTLGLEAQAVKEAPAPAPAPAPAYDPIWPKFVLYYESLGRGSPEKEDLDNPLMDVQEHYNLFKAEYHAKREALRDEFAGQAMQALLSRYPAGFGIDYTDLVHQAYHVAKGMLCVRDKEIVDS